MNPPMFTCSACRLPIEVASERAGEAATCPHCGKVVAAPLLQSAAPVREREDSIFSEPEDDDNESLFDHGSDKRSSRLEMPKASPAMVAGTPNVMAEPTQRPPGLVARPPVARAQTPARPVRALPVSTPDSKAFAISSNNYPTPPKGSVDAVNPFVMEAAIPTEFSPQVTERDEPSATRRMKAPPADAAPKWKLWIIFGLAAYSFLMTILALWGWMRTPPAAPAKQDAAPASQKVKMR